GPGIGGVQRDGIVQGEFQQVVTCVAGSAHGAADLLPTGASFPDERVNAEGVAHYGGRHRGMLLVVRGSQNVTAIGCSQAASAPVMRLTISAALVSAVRRPATQRPERITQTWSARRIT